MADFQEQLKQYRLQKKRQATVESFKSKFWKFWMLGIKENKEKCETTIDLQDDSTPLLSNSPTSTTCSNDEAEYVASSEEEPSPQIASIAAADPREQSKLLKYTLYFVYFLFWSTLYVIAIELQFGLVFLMFSALFGIYFNTRTGPKQRNEISAYSVFNKDFESIDGTLKAEQFEREMRYGAGSVR